MRVSLFNLIALHFFTLACVAEGRAENDVDESVKLKLDHLDFILHRDKQNQDKTMKEMATQQYATSHLVEMRDTHRNKGRITKKMTVQQQGKSHLESSASTGQRDDQSRSKERAWKRVEVLGHGKADAFGIPPTQHPLHNLDVHEDPANLTTLGDRRIPQTQHPLHNLDVHEDPANFTTLGDRRNKSGIPQTQHPLHSLDVHEDPANFTTLGDRRNKSGGMKKIATQQDDYQNMSSLVETHGNRHNRNHAVTSQQQALPSLHFHGGARTHAYDPYQKGEIKQTDIQASNFSSKLSPSKKQEAIIINQTSMQTQNFNSEPTSTALLSTNQTTDGKTHDFCVKCSVVHQCNLVKVKRTWRGTVTFECIPPVASGDPVVEVFPTQNKCFHLGSSKKSLSEIKRDVEDCCSADEALCGPEESEAFLEETLTKTMCADMKTKVANEETKAVQGAAQSLASSLMAVLLFILELDA